METCKYGSGAGKRKPTAVKWKGVVCRAYKITNHKVSKDLAVLSENIKGKYALPNDGMPSRVFKCGNYSGWKKECESSDKIKIK